MSFVILCYSFRSDRQFFFLNESKSPHFQSELMQSPLSLIYRVNVYSFYKQVIWDIIYLVLRVDPWSVEVKVIAVSKRNLSKTRHRLNFRQFSPINNWTLSHLCSRILVFARLTLVPLFGEPRRDRILPLCRVASRGLFEHRHCSFSSFDARKYILENF